LSHIHASTLLHECPFNSEGALLHGAAGLMRSGPDAASAYQVRDKLASCMTRVLDLDPVVGPSLSDVRGILNGPVAYVDR